MSHDIDMTNGRANIAFMGDRSDIWHRLGQEMQPGMTIDEWSKAAGLDWSAQMVPAIASLEGAQWDHIPATKRFAPADNFKFVCRSDNGAVLGYGTDQYTPHQPSAVLDWFQRYISVDDRFQLDVAGSLDDGRKIWATAVYKEPLAIAGDKHVARILMSTTFDGSGATINQGTMTRVVCRNTLRMAHSEKDAVIRTRHNTRFDAARVGKELAAIAGGFAHFKAVGDAMAAVEMSKDAVRDFFKDCLDIDRTAKPDDISTRKLNQFKALGAAYGVSVKSEGASGAWAALQAITRYVDHDRGGSKDEESKFASAQFGSGDALKGKAMGLLLPLIKDRVPVLAA